MAFRNTLYKVLNEIGKFSVDSAIGWCAVDSVIDIAQGDSSSAIWKIFIGSFIAKEKYEARKRKADVERYTQLARKLQKDAEQALARSEIAIVELEKPGVMTVKVARKYNITDFFPRDIREYYTREKRPYQQPSMPGHLHDFLDEYTEFQKGYTGRN